MRLISGTIAAEEKGRVARADKVIKMAIYLYTSSFSPLDNNIYTLDVLFKHYISCCINTLHDCITIASGNDTVSSSTISLSWYAHLTLWPFYVAVYHFNYSTLWLWSWNLRWLWQGGQGSKGLWFGSTQVLGYNNNYKFPSKQVLILFLRMIFPCIAIFVSAKHLKLFLLEYNSFLQWQINTYEKEVDEMKHMTRQEYIAYLRRYYC